MLGVALCGEVAVEVDGRRLPDALLPGRQGRLVLAYLTCERHRSVPREELADLLWGDRLPASWQASLSAVISKLRRLLTEAGLDGPAALPSAFGSYRLHLPDDARVDWEVAHARLADAERALAGGDAAAALAAATEVETIARHGFLTDDCRWVDDQRDRLADLRLRAVQLRAEAHLLTGERVRAVDAAREALALDPVRESGYRILMRALAAAGERGEALRVWEQCRTALVEELGTDPAPDTEAVYLEILREETTPTSLPSGVVTFLLTDIVGSSGLWERHPTAMAAALARHDELVDEVARAHGGQLLKAKLEGDATVSVFPRATSGALAALALRDALEREPWPEDAPRVRMALHTGEAFERDGDFFGPALNRAARLRSLAGGSQILVSQALAELVRDHLPADTELRSLGHRDLRGLSRGEHVFELAPAGAPASATATPAPLELPPVPPPLVPSGPFVGRESELEQLSVEWELASAGSPRAAVIGGEPGVGKTRLAAERAQLAHDAGGLVLYGRCDEDLGAPYQPFSEAFRTLLPRLGAERLASVRGVEEIARLVPEVADVVPDLGPPTRTDPDTERYALFDAVARLLVSVSVEVPVLLVLDDLHWATKPTLLLLRHVLRNAEQARLHVLATYRTTDLDPAHPLAATLTDLHRDGTATRLVLSGLGEHEVTAYLGAAGYDDDDLAATLASVTSGNPFFLLEVLRHLEETGGRWDPTTLPQGVREAVGRRLTRLSPDANEALLAGAVVGGRFALDLVERVVGRDLVDAVSEACDAELVVEERGGWFRFNHDIVRRSLLAGVASVKRVRLHQRIADQLETTAPDDGTALLADLAHHYFESAWAGNAAKAVEYCRRAADQAMAGLAYEGAADLYDRALQAMEIDDRPADDGERAELLLARCEALLAAGDVTQATDAVARLEEAAVGSPRLAAWATCFAGQLAVLIHPDQLDTIEGAVATAAEQLAALDDAAGEAKAHTVRASCLARLGRHADCETALDRALTAARRGDDHRRVNAVLAGAPVAALWGPNPVPRAGGRCLDVIRLLRITTGSPAVEATSTRCQAVLEAFRGRAHAARRMLDSARQTLTELGLRHALLEVDLFAGVVELVGGDPAAAEVPLRRAYAGFRRMGVDADAAQAAALLARACLELGRDDEADDLCADSERLGGNDLKASIAWRAVRAQLLSRQGEHATARELAEAAVAVAERTDALVDHGDACVALATVLDAAGDRAGARRAADAAAALYERKGAVALVERARRPAVRAADTKEAPSAGLVDAIDNRATALYRTMLERFAARDWEGLRSLAPTPVLLEDRRAVVGRSTTTVDNVQVFEYMAEIQMTHVDYTVIATRGDRLALSMWVNRGQEGLEVPALFVGGIDDAGIPEFNVLFDADDLEAAFAELDARYLAGEAAPYADVWRQIAGAASATNSRSFAALPDGPVVDGNQRWFPLSDVATSLEQMLDQVPDLRVRHVAVHRLDDRGAVVSSVVEGSTDGGTRAEWSANLVFRVGDSVETEVFRGDQLDAALARFDELGRAPRSWLENVCTRAMQRFSDAYARGDWDAMEAWPCATDFLFEWRGKLAMYGQRVQGLAGAIALLRAWAEVGSAPLKQTPIALRGDRLALFRSRIEQSAQAHSDSLCVVGVDAAGTAEFLIGFDPEQLDEAFEELDARYLAGEAAPYADVWREIAGVADTILVGDLHVRYTAVHRLDRHGAVVSSVLGGSEDGSLAEWSVVGVVAVGERYETEIFPEDQLAAALARFDELGRQRDAPSQLENVCTRAMQRFSDAYARRDWKTIEAWPHRADYAFEWRGTLALYGPRVLDRDGVIAVLRAWADVGVARQGYTPIAVRGDRLALFRIESVTPDGSAETYDKSLFVVGVAADGAAAFHVGFDPEQLDDALAELDARYAAGEGAPFADVLGVVTATWAAYNTHDWARFEALCSEDFGFVDHRPIGWGALDRGEYAGHLRAMVELVSGLRGYSPSLLRLTRRGVVSTMHIEVVDDGGNPFDTDFLALFLVADGRSHRNEFFSLDEMDTALARFAELEARYAADDNLAARTNAAAAEAFNARDVEWLQRLYRDELVHEDRRKGFSTLVRGGDAVLEEITTIWTLGSPHVEPPETWALRGERLGLFTYHTHPDRSDFHLEILQLVEVDDEGKTLWVGWYDPNDPENVDAAFAELDARYLAGEGAPHRDAIEPVFNMGRAYNRRDRDDVCVRVRAVRGAGHGAAAFEIRNTVVEPHGGVVESTYHLVTAIERGQVTHAEFFAVDDLDAALARVEEFRRRPGLENAATRAEALGHALLLRGDWAAMGNLLAEDVVREYRRKGFAYRLAGPQEVLADNRSVVEVATAFLDTRVIAIRGDRLALTHTRGGGSGPGAFVDEVLQVTEVDPSGRIVRHIVFDGDAIDAAYAELDRCDLEDLRRRPGPENAASRVMARVNALLVGKEVGAVAQLETDDATFEDRRRGLAHATGGRQPMAEYIRQTAGMDFARIDNRVLATRGERLALLHVHAEYGDSAFEVDLLQLVEVDATGRLTASVVFDTDAVDAAHAELDARYLEGDAAPYADLWRGVLRDLDAIGRRDLSALPHSTLVDHSQQWLPPGDAVATLRPLIELLPDLTLRVVAVYRLDHRGAVVHWSFDGSTTDGAQGSWSYVSLLSPDMHAEIYSEDQLEDALARFDVLEAEPFALENAASRALARGGELLVQQDLVALAQLTTDDSVIEDRRRGLAHGASGRHQMQEYNRLIGEMGLARIEHKVLATRGERLALVRVVGEWGPSAFEVELLQVMEVDGDGRLARGVLFDRDEEDAAYAELEERYMAGEAAPFADTWRWIMGVKAAVNEGTVPTLPDGYTMIDRRSGGVGFPAYDATAALQAQRVLVPDHRLRVIAVHRLDSHGAVVTQVAEGTSADGLTASWRMVEIATLDKGVELFSDDQLDQALVRFEELGSA